MCSLVTSIFLYACESWTLSAVLQRKLPAIKVRCYRKIVCNEEVRAKIQRAIEPHGDLLNIVKRRKRGMDISRSLGVAKTVC